MQNLQKSSGGTLTHKDLPPDDLLDRWSIKPPPPPRGRTGPYPQHEPSPTTQTQDQTALLVATVRTTSAEGSSGEGLRRDAQNTSQAATRE